MAETIISVPAGSITTTGIAPKYKATIPVAKASLAVTGKAPSLKVTLRVPKGALTTASFAPDPRVAIRLRSLGIQVAAGPVGSPSSILLSGVPYTIFINGVNVNQYIYKPSLRRSLQIGNSSRGTLELTCKSIDVGYRPTIDDRITVYAGSDIFFSGWVESTEEIWHKGTSGLNEVEVNCTDYGSICDRRIVGKYYTLFMGGIPAILVADLVRNFLDGTGITYDPTGTPSVILEEVMFNYITVTEALNAVASMANADWSIDIWGVLRFFEKDAGIAVAPYTITDNNGLYDDIRVTRSRTGRANRQGVRSSNAATAVWTDTITATAGQIMFPTTYLQEVVPYITVNGVVQAVVKLEDILDTPYDFYYVPNGVGVFSNVAQPAGASVVIMYPGKLPEVYWAEDAADIAAHGKFEAVEEVKDVTSASNLQQTAQALLERNLAEATQVEITSREPGWLPGQLVTVTHVKPPVSGTFVIESVESDEVVEAGVVKFKHRIRAINNSLKRINRFDNFMAKMIERDKQALYPISYKIGFVLAETIEGITNPGLSTGVKMAIRTADKDGILRDCTLNFKSVEDGTPTTSRIVVDVFRNGVSIFPSGSQMIYNIGAQGVQRQFLFATMPYKVYKGDVFTIEVLEADSVATDGTLELVVYG